jgi:hypothetical protein
MRWVDWYGDGSLYVLDVGSRVEPSSLMPPR